MIGLVLLSTGSALLACLAGYFCWLKVRTVRLQRDLLLLRCQLTDGIRRMDAGDDAACLQVQSLIDAVVERPHFVSLSTMFIVLTRVDEEDELAIASSSREEVQALLISIRKRFAARLAIYMLYESVIGMVLSWIASMSRKATWKQPPLGRSIERSMTAGAQTYSTAR